MIPYQVDESAGGCHQDVHAVLELGLLNVHVEAAKDGEWDDVRMFGDIVYFLHILQSTVHAWERV